MKIGVNTFLTDEGIEGTVLGQALEERGFESLLLSEHSHIPVGTRGPTGGELGREYFRTVDPFVTLGAVAAVTQRLRVGTSVALLIQRDVLHAAKEVATLDRISHGRVVFGVGVGWNRQEMANHGTDPATRGALLDEQLAALRVIWTEERAEFHGKFLDFDPIHSWPKPVQQPGPPIFIGGGEAALRRAARLGVGWMPNGAQSPAAVAEQFRLVAEHGGAVPITGTPTPRDAAVLDAYAEHGVERVTFRLPTLPESESLRFLDEAAALAQRYRD